MKKLIFRIVTVLVILVILGLAVVFLSLNSLVKKGVETVGPKLTKTEMRLKKASLSPFSGNGQLTGLFVGNPEGFKTPSAIEVGDISVGLQPSSVLSDKVIIETVNIQGPEITLEGSLSGNNLTKILDNLNAVSGETKPPTQTKSDTATDKKFVVKDLVIQKAKVSVSITALGGKAMSLPIPDIHLTDIGAKENGVTAAELAKQILQPLLANATRAATEGVANLGKQVQEIGKGTADQLEKTATGLKSLLK